jgi:hypothetical protein
MSILTVGSQSYSCPKNTVPVTKSDFKILLLVYIKQNEDKWLAIFTSFL